MKRMKKVLGIALAGILSLACVACGAKKETAVLTYEVAGGINYEMTLDAENDIVQKMVQVTTIDLSLYTEDQIAVLEASMDEYESAYEAIEGVDYEGEVIDTTMIETITIDMSNSETLEALKESELLPIEGESSAISLEKTVENLESQGWTVK